MTLFRASCTDLLVLGNIVGCEPLINEQDGEVGRRFSEASLEVKGLADESSNTQNHVPNKRENSVATGTGHSRTQKAR